MATGKISKAKSATHLSAVASNPSWASTNNGSFIGAQSYRLSYEDEIVEFTCRFTLSGVTANVRPTITLTNPLFASVPTFEARGNPVLRGASGSAVASDECFATHSYGESTIEIGQNNFIGTAPAGYATFQIPGTA